MLQLSNSKGYITHRDAEIVCLSYDNIENAFVTVRDNMEDQQKAYSLEMYRCRIGGSVCSMPAASYTITIT